VVEEQRRVLKVGDGESWPLLDYDALKEMQLLDRCLKETLRLRPPIMTMMRMCKTEQVKQCKFACEIICHSCL
jgi:cytochrome P450